MVSLVDSTVIRSKYHRFCSGNLWSIPKTSNLWQKLRESGWARRYARYKFIRALERVAAAGTPRGEIGIRGSSHPCASTKESFMHVGTLVLVRHTGASASCGSSVACARKYRAMGCFSYQAMNQYYTPKTHSRRYIEVQFQSNTRITTVKCFSNPVFEVIASSLLIHPHAVAQPTDLEDLPRRDSTPLNPRYTLPFQLLVSRLDRQIRRC